MTVVFKIAGEPVGKARPRYTFKTGRAYTPKKTKDYERHVAESYKEHGGYWFGDDPISVEITAYFKLPKSASKKKKAELMAGYPAKKPDVDNICKIILDGLQGTAFRDDKNVWSTSIKKFWCKADEDGCVVVCISDGK